MISVISALEGTGIVLPKITEICHLLPLYSQGFGWVSVALVALIVSLVLNKIKK
jgi:branched-subunit amino acid permease